MRRVTTLAVLSSIILLPAGCGTTQRPELSRVLVAPGGLEIHVPSEPCTGFVGTYYSRAEDYVQYQNVEVVKNGKKRSNPRFNFSKPGVSREVARFMIGATDVFSSRRGDICSALITNRVDDKAAAARMYFDGIIAEIEVASRMEGVVTMEDAERELAFASQRFEAFSKSIQLK